MTDREVVEGVRCDFCGAEKGAPCRDTRSGALTRRPHPSRREAAGWSAVGDVPGGDEPEDHWDRWPGPD